MAFWPYRRVFTNGYEEGMSSIVLPTLRSLPYPLCGCTSREGGR